MRCAPGSTRPSPVLPGRRDAVAFALISFLLAAIGCKAIEPLNPDPIEVASSGDRTEGVIRDALRRFVALPPSPLEQLERLEQLRALENGMRIDASIVDRVPLGVDTPDDLERARASAAEEDL